MHILEPLSLMHTDSRIEDIHRFLLEISHRNITRNTTSNRLEKVIDDLDQLKEDYQRSALLRYNSIFEGIPDIALVLDQENRIKKVNIQTFKTLGWEEKKLSGKSIRTLFQKEEWDKIDDCLLKVGSDGFCLDIEQNMITAFHSEIPVSFSCSLLRDNIGEAYGKLFIAKDISRLKKTESELKGKNAELNTFIYKASHDLKGPLASILGLVNLSKEELDIQSLKHYINLIEKSTLRLDSILVALTEVTRVTQSEVVSQRIDFKDLVEFVSESLEFIPGKRDVTLELDLHRHKKVFYSHPGIMKSVIQNLVENAIKYKSENVDSFVKISISDFKQGVKIVIEDNGLGMSEEVQENIFKMFYRGTTHQNGSGLGLYIVKTGVEKLGGTITVKSQENKGSSFDIYIPGNKKELSRNTSAFD